MDQMIRVCSASSVPLICWCYLRIKLKKTNDSSNENLGEKPKFKLKYLIFEIFKICIAVIFNFNLADFKKYILEQRWIG